MKDFLIRFKRSIKKSYRKIKYLDRTKARFFATLTIISVFCLYPAITYSYFVITEHLNSAVITIANLKYELTSSNTSFKNNSIALTPGQELSLELNLKSLNNMDTKYALDYLCDSPDVKVYYVEKKLQNVEGVIASLNSIIDIKIEIHNNSDSNQTVTFNLKGGYLQNNLESNIVEQTPGASKSVAYNYTGEFWGQKDKIKIVVFETEMNPKENATYSYDVSEKKNKSVMSYLVPDTEGEVTDTTTFTLYIQSNGKTIANEDSSYLFRDFDKLESIDGIENLDTSMVTDMNRMFVSCSSLTSLNVSSFDTSKVTSMERMFESCSRLTSLDLSNFDTSNVTDMSNMFRSCSNLTSLDVSNFDTSKVASMGSMFYGCSNLTSLDVSNFDTSNVADMGGMFSGCSKLTTTITIRGTKCTNYTNMFSGTALEAEALITVNYTEDASSLVDNMIATKSSNSNVVKNSISIPVPKYSITLNATSDISLSSVQGYEFQEITINTSKDGYAVSSFKLNGTLMSGHTFKMPGENVIISDVVTAEVTVVESEHNPYANNINNQEYLNKTWDGATSLTVVLEYQTESTNYDWIYLYDKNNTAYGKYGGTTRKTETIIIPGDTLRIVFRTDGSGNNYYGFKATITPNY